MFKKNLWVVGLLAVLAIMFAGCVDAFVEDDSGVEMEVANLQEVIKDVPDGPITDWGAIFDGTPFVRCGPDIKFTIKTEGGVKKLVADGMKQTWGEGFDVINQPNYEGNKCTAAGYKAGDTFYFKGSSDPGKELMLNLKGSGYGPGIDWRGKGGAFEETFTLNADNVTMINTGNPKTIRIHYSDAGSRIGTIVFEQIIVTGKRKAGDTVAPPVYEIAGAGGYTVPADGIDEFALDLNLAVISGLSPDNPNKNPAAKINPPSKETPSPTYPNGNLTVKFDINGQGIFIPFTEEQKNYVRNAYVNNYKFDVTIDGSETGSASFRWCITDGTGGQWDMTTLTTSTVFSTVDPDDATTTTGTIMVTSALDGRIADSSTSYWDKWEKLNGLVIQSRPGGGGSEGTAISTGAWTLIIKSIKFKLNSTGRTAPTAITAVKFGIDAPYPGFTAPATVDGKGTSGGVPDVANKLRYKGNIKWSPALNDGKFEKLTVYTATITLVARPGYTLPATLAAANISIEDQTATSSIAANTASYANGVITCSFPMSNFNSDPFDSPIYKTGTTFKVKVDGVDVNATGPNVGNSSGIAKLKADDSGYVFNDNSGYWQGAYSYFSVNLGEAFSGFTSIKFKMKGVAGDMGWKTAGIRASTTAPTDDNQNVTANDALWNQYYGNNGMAEQQFTATFTSTVSATTMYFVIGIHGGKKIFEIYDIEFIK
jgi:hypothetical protein